MINTSKLKAVREKRGISQEIMADRLHISQSAYARMESGTQKIEAGQFFKMADELQTPARHFLDHSRPNMQDDFQPNQADPHPPHYYSVPKDLYEQHLKLLKEMMTEIRKERQEYLELLKLKKQ